MFIISIGLEFQKPILGYYKVYDGTGSKYGWISTISSQSFYFWILPINKCLYSSLFF